MEVKEDRVAYTKWHTREILVLARLWSGEKSAQVVSLELNRPVNSIIKKAHSLGLSPHGLAARWSEEESAYLEVLAETDTIECITNKYNFKVSQEPGWKYRSQVAIKKKLSLLGFTDKPLIGYTNLTDFAKYLGRSPSYMRVLVETNKLPATRVGNQDLYVSDDDVIKFMTTYPMDAGLKMSQEGIMWFLQLLKCYLTR